MFYHNIKESYRALGGILIAYMQGIQRIRDHYKRNIPKVFTPIGP